MRRGNEEHFQEKQMKILWSILPKHFSCNLFLAIFKSSQPEFTGSKPTLDGSTGEIYEICSKLAVHKPE